MGKDYLILNQGPNVVNTLRVLPRWFCLVSNCAQSYWSKDEESIPMPVADIVNLIVSIWPDFYCHCLAGVAVQFGLFSFLCYCTRCPLQAPMGCHIVHVHQGPLLTALSFPLRRTGSCSLVQEPGKVTWAQGPGINQVGGFKDLDQKTWVLQDSPALGFTDLAPTAQVVQRTS